MCSLTSSFEPRLILTRTVLNVAAKLNKHHTIWFALLLLLGASPVSHAEYFGLQIGRTAQIATHPKMTLETGYSTGDMDDVDYSHLGFRLNYKFAPNVLFFGDLGQSEFGAADEISYGLGAFYGFGQQLFNKTETAAKVSFHRADFAGSSGQSTCIQYFTEDLLFVTVPGSCSSGAGSGGDIRNIKLELLISGDITAASLKQAMQWYANAGMQLVKRGGDNDTVLGFGGGVVLPLNRSEAYAGIESADGLTFGFGFRYFVQ